MHSVATGLVLIPGAVALLVLLVFTYLYEQNRHTYFRAWQLAWAAYTLHYALKAVEYFRGPSALLFLLSSLLLVAMAICIFVSTRLMKEPFQLKWYDVALTVTGVLLAYVSLRAHMASGVFSESATSGTAIFAAGNRARGDTALLLVPFLPLRFSQKLRGLPDAGVFPGALGGADGRRAAPSTFPRCGRAIGRLPGADSADAAGHRHGDGAV